MTSDHIPPKNLFSKPYPSDFITVPSCISCNRGASKDDEYFRMVISFRHDTYDHPEASNIYPKVIRSLQRSKAKGLRRKLLKSVKEIDLNTPYGLYVGKTGQYDVNLERLDRIAERIIKGLVFHEQKKRLPEGYMTVAYVLDSFEEASVNTKEILGTLISSVQDQEVKSVGNGVFTYRMRFLEEDMFDSISYFTIYEVVEFIGLTVRVEAT